MPLDKMIIDNKSGGTVALFWVQKGDGNDIGSGLREIYVSNSVVALYDVFLIEYYQV